MATALDISPELAAAQARLLALREKAQAGRLADETVSSRPSPASGVTAVPAHLAPALKPEPDTAVSWLLRNASAELARRRDGVGGRAPTARAASLTLAPASPDAPAETTLSVAAVPAAGSLVVVRVWPALGVALAAAELSPLYRFYVACQTLDPDGRRAFDVAALRATFTTKGSARYLFSWRRMRQILAEGEGKLWNRAGERLYLHAIARIAHLLALESIGRGVELPVSLVFAGQGAFNAHLHAAWLAANGDETRPISQAAIAGATAVPERTQRHYNRVAGVVRQKNLQIGERATEEGFQDAAWQHGRNSFMFIDHQGQRGRPNGRYLARRLPNGYQRRHPLAVNGRRRKINKQLNSLVNHEERGTPFKPFERLYFANGKDAARAANRQPERGVFWPEQGRKAGPWVVWHEVKPR